MEDDDTPRSKRRKTNPPISLSSTPKSLPAPSELDAVVDVSSYSDASEDLEDDDLPNVSISFGTPTHAGLTAGSITVGDVYWVVFPHWPPWPAIVTQNPRKVNKKKSHIRCIFFCDPTLSANKAVNETKVRVTKNCVFHFEEDGNKLQTFLEQRVRTHHRYDKCKEYLETAIADAKHYLLRKNEITDGDSPKTLFQSVCRRRLILNTTFTKPDMDPAEFSSFGHTRDDSDDSEQEEKEEEQEHQPSIIALEERDKLKRKKEELKKDQRYATKKVTGFLRRKLVKKYLKEVVMGEQHSVRHKAFAESTANVQRRLSFQSHFGPWMHLDDDNKSKIIDSLREIVCELKVGPSADNTDDYVYSVLLPEAVIKMMVDVEELTQEDAERKYIQF